MKKKMLTGVVHYLVNLSILMFAIYLNEMAIFINDALNHFSIDTRDSHLSIGVYLALLIVVIFPIFHYVVSKWYFWKGMTSVVLRIHKLIFIFIHFTALYLAFFAS